MRQAQALHPIDPIHSLSTSMNSAAEASSELLPQRVGLGPAYGALLICTFISLMLYGVALHQVYQFTFLDGSNSRLVNYYVAVLVVLDALHTVLAIHTNYRNFISKYFTPDSLADPLWSLNLQPVITGTIIVTCQMFFARLGKMYQPLVKYTGGMFVVELAAAIAFTWIAFKQDSVHDLNNFSWLQSGGYGVVITADAIMTTVLVVALHRSRNGFKRTNSVLDLLTAYAICTGLITLVFATMCFGSAVISPNNLLFGALDLVCVKIYINSVLAALNARSTLAALDAGFQDQSTRDIFLGVMPRHSSHTIVNGYGSPVRWHSGEDPAEAESAAPTAKPDTETETADSVIDIMAATKVMTW
ncbi:uncharacterized protein TRAVEDRAFT_44667 [Trametes versicolor FP-101664 SS1]|uniref:uncharacterized protein n=1 Tax=Trametes versicolor (strain FP-101664) TaxID=717944 RepID=UPI0004622F2C|nr:uncharacterized protein TRAVEDRAFT_44667 [Trametes versicolor FP-101664 SS1]EIW61846.1 hypothetical protein TRAVEDRAFT_44667 [Trametes versicolor FP-101664 SS1]